MAWFVRYFYPQFFVCKCVKHAILTQTFPLTFHFVIGTTFTLSQQSDYSIIQPKWASLTWHFQHSHFKHCVFKHTHSKNMGPKYWALFCSLFCARFFSLFCLVFCSLSLSLLFTVLFPVLFSALLSGQFIVLLLYSLLIILTVFNHSVYNILLCFFSVLLLGLFAGHSIALFSVFSLFSSLFSYLFCSRCSFSFSLCHITD